MILADKLNKLRTSSGLSQEQLAEKMNVSRQSISKWESGASIPTMDKIVELSNIYGISTDFLLKDELEELPGEVVADFGGEDPVIEVTLEDANNYLSAIEKVKNKIAIGVFMCIFSPVCMMALLGYSEMSKNKFSDEIASGIGIGILLAMVAVAVALFVLTRIDTKKFEHYEKELLHLSYGVQGILQKEEEEYLPTYYKSVALGVFLCIAAAIPRIIMSMIGEEANAEYLELFGVVILLSLVACGVFFIVRASITKGAYDKLLQKGDYTQSKKKAGKKLSTFSGAYWTVLTAVYLLISFLTNRWETTWIVWPVGAVLFAAIYIVLEHIVLRVKK